MRIFVSHSSDEREIAEAIVRRLIRDGHDAFASGLDTNLSAGGNWAQEIATNLARATAMIVLVSPSSMKSIYVRREIEFALGSEQFKNRLIPVLLRRASDTPWILHELDSVQPPPDASPESIAALVSRAVKLTLKVTEKAKP